MTRACEWCGGPFEPKQQRSRCCSGNCRKRAADERARMACPGCGGLREPGSARPGKAQGQCDACQRLDQAADRCGRLIGIYLLWQQGHNRSEIARRVGSTPGAVNVRVSQMRTAGVGLDYRRRDNLARMDRIYDGRDAWRAEIAA